MSIKTRLEKLERNRPPCRIEVRGCEELTVEEWERRAQAYLETGENADYDPECGIYKIYEE